MKKCLKVSFSGPVADQFLHSIQGHARKLGVEGTLQFMPADKLIKIVVYGDKDHVDLFLDNLHKDGAKAGVADITAEPMLKERDYRGVFRIIE